LKKLFYLQLNIMILRMSLVEEANEGQPPSYSSSDKSHGEVHIETTPPYDTDSTSHQKEMENINNFSPANTQLLKNDCFENRTGDDEEATCMVNDTCTICLEIMNEEDGNLCTISTCNHTFHKDCIMRWRKEKASCPYCRGTLPDELDRASMTIRAVIANAVFCPIGMIWPLFVVAMFLTLETAVFSIAVLLCFLLAVLVSFRYEDYNPLETICVLYPLGVFAATTALLSQFMYVLLKTASFYIAVCRCQRRWCGAGSYITDIVEHSIERIVHRLFAR